MEGLEVKVTWMASMSHYKVTLIFCGYVFTSFPNRAEYKKKDGLDPTAKANEIKAALLAATGG
jgi:hypothetical protein